MMNGLWTLWAEGRAVDNGFIVIHGKRPGSPAGLAGELSTSPQPFVFSARQCSMNQWCWLLATIEEPGWRGVHRHLPSAEGQTLRDFPHPHRQASMRNLAACALISPTAD